jgi:hypothetical protein
MRAIFEVVRPILEAALVVAITFPVKFIHMFVWFSLLRGESCLKEEVGSEDWI